MADNPIENRMSKVEVEMGDLSGKMDAMQTTLNKIEGNHLKTLSSDVGALSAALTTGMHSVDLKLANIDGNLSVMKPLIITVIGTILAAAAALVITTLVST